MFSNTSLDSDTLLFFRFFEVFKLSMVREEIVKRIFRVNSNFYSITFLLNLTLFFRKREPTGDKELPLDKVQACDLLWDRMFNLESCVHLHEIMFIWVKIENELNSTCIIISNSLGSFNSWLTYLRSYGFWNIWRSFFNYFLMPSLDGTISFVQMNIIFHHITKNLNFNMTWFCDVFFDQNSIITERF